MSVAFNELETLASLCRESYFDFVKEFWDVVIPEKPVFNWHIPYLCDELQVMAERVMEGKPKKYDLVVNISPGTTKSTIASIFYVPWMWTRMPTLRAICGSHTDSLVLDLSRKARDVINSEKYKLCFPGLELRDDQDTKGYYVNVKGGARFSCTIGGKTPTGMHGHIQIVDDPIDPQKAMSDLELAAANTWMSDTLASRKVDKGVTPLILVMQRLAQNDPSGERLEKKKVKHICLPCDDSWKIRPKELKKYYIMNDGLMDPIRLSRSVLEDQHEELGDYGYSGQYGQNPVPQGGGMFKVGRLNMVEVTALPKSFKRIVRYWDNAGSPKKTDKKRAFTVGFKIGQDFNNRFWLLDCVRVRMEAAKRERLKRLTAKQDGVKVVVVQEQEGGSGGQESAENTVRNLAGFRVKVDCVRGDKVLRADPFADQVNGGNVYVVSSSPWLKDFLTEMQFFPFSTFKDQVDAASGAFAHLNKGHRRVGAF